MYKSIISVRKIIDIDGCLGGKKRKKCSIVCTFRGMNFLKMFQCLLKALFLYFTGKIELITLALKLIIQKPFYINYKVIQKWIKNSHMIVLPNVIFCLPPEQDSRGNYTTLNPIYAKQFWMPDIFIGKYMHIFPY
jgi:hypothetical protein